jgi:hypothetical protein
MRFTIPWLWLSAAFIDGWKRLVTMLVVAYAEIMRGLFASSVAVGGNCAMRVVFGGSASSLRGNVGK